MRGQYRALNAVGGLTIETSSLNLIWELKANQETFANNLKTDLQDSMFQTL